MTSLSPKHKTTSRLLQRGNNWNQSIFSYKKQENHIYLWSDKGLKGTVVNLTCIFKCTLKYNLDLLAEEAWHIEVFPF